MAVMFPNLAQSLQVIQTATQFRSRSQLAAALGVSESGLRNWLSDSDSPAGHMPDDRAERLIELVANALDLPSSQDAEKRRDAARGLLTEGEPLRLYAALAPIGDAWDNFLRDAVSPPALEFLVGAAVNFALGEPEDFRPAADATIHVGERYGMRLPALVGAKDCEAAVLCAQGDAWRILRLTPSGGRVAALSLRSSEPYLPGHDETGRRRAMIAAGAPDVYRYVALIAEPCFPLEAAELMRRTSELDQINRKILASLLRNLRGTSLRAYSAVLRIEGTGAGGY